MARLTTSEKTKQYFLVLDDNIDDRFLTCMLLQRFGYNIFTAHTVEEAIEFMNVAPPTAVISDADSNGATFLRSMRKNPNFSDIPLVLLAFTPNPPLEERARNGEFFALLRKPLNVEEFFPVVQSVMEKERRRYIRIITYLPATLGDDLGGGEGYITVISEFGMFFRTLEPRPVNTHLPVSFVIEGRTIKLEAKVLYTTSFDEGPFKEPGIGMKFEKISPEDRDFIKSCILAQIKEGIVR